MNTNKKITYAAFHRWYKEVVPQPEKLFSKKNEKRIISTLKRLEEENISYRIAELEDSFLDWFEPLYKKTILEKNNPKIHDIKSSTLLNPASESKYYTLTILQDGTILGGVLFGVRTEKVMVAYKAIQNQWLHGTQQASPTLFAEYIICQHAYDIKKQYISHGKDRNPYGPNAAIGLANYKLSVGYEAYVGEQEDYQPTEFVLSNEEMADVLVFHYPDNEEKITNATLFTSEENKDKYTQVCSYPNQLKIELVIR